MHEYYLSLALNEAQKRRGFCAPNPSVGAVLIKDQQIIASGNHYQCGDAHAEVDAIRKAGDAANGATLYVTLEPCSHLNKKTPPCTQLIIEKNICQVIYAYKDPNPDVDGVKILKEAGIDCQYFPIEAINDFYCSYSYWWQTKKPFITAKLAMSLDAKIAGEHGKPLVITHLAAKEFTHQQRKITDAILTTATTIKNDDPLLNARIDQEVYTKKIFILDTQLSIPTSARIFNSAQSITIFYDQKLHVPKSSNVTYIPISKTAEGLALEEIINYIGQQGIHDLWIEAGGKCFSAFAKNNLLNRAFVYIAPKIIGEQGLGAFEYQDNIFHAAAKQQWKELGADIICEFHW